MSAPITMTDLRENLASYLDRVEADREELVVTRQGHEPAVLMPLAELEGLRETLYLLLDPANALHLMAAMDELKAGRGVEMIWKDGELVPASS